jgi:hypothetical protein
MKFTIISANLQRQRYEGMSSTGKVSLGSSVLMKISPKVRIVLDILWYISLYLDEHA